MSATPAPLLRVTIYGTEDGSDPAEEFHEASRLYPSLTDRQAAGIARLTASAELQEIAAMPIRHNSHLASVQLQLSKPPVVSLWDALQRRRSTPPSQRGPLRAESLAQLLHAGYGALPTGRRTVPSGGGLYPLELFVLTREVDGIPVGTWHLEPISHRLELVLDGEPPLSECVPATELVEHARAVVFVAATFWRTRFKYGLRGYRFALLEAGHVAQNVLLAAAALRIDALPLGGFFDARVDALLGLDGVDRSVLYGLVIGGEPG